MGHCRSLRGEFPDNGDSQAGTGDGEQTHIWQWYVSGVMEYSGGGGGQGMENENKSVFLSICISLDFNPNPNTSLRPTTTVTKPTPNSPIGSYHCQPSMPISATHTSINHPFIHISSVSIRHRSILSRYHLSILCFPQIIFPRPLSIDSSKLSIPPHPNIDPRTDIHLSS